MWLAVDVWLCTASILNLCAISVDRYLAISRPFKYPQLMSPSRAKLLIICVWILSFIICFPPLLGWEDPAAVAHDNASPSSSSSLFQDEGGTSSERVSGIEVKGIFQKTSELFDSNDEYEHLFSAAAPYSSHLGSSASPSNSSVVGRSSNGEERMMCTLTSEPGYIIYSSCGSFWVPMFLMLVFYWKIYKTATSATAAFRRGFIEKKSVLSKTNSPSQAQTNSSLTLRVHRGSRITMRHSNGCISELLPPVTAVSLQLTRRSFDSQLAARNIGPVPSGAVKTLNAKETAAVPLNLVELKALPPKIVVTASPSAGEETKQGKEGEESRAPNERKSSIFSVDEEIIGKDYEKNSGRNERRPTLATHEERKETGKKSGKYERKSSILSTDEERKWKEGQERRLRKPSVLSTQAEKKRKEEECGRSERKSSIFSMDEEMKWKEGQEMRGRNSCMLSWHEDRPDKEELSGRNIRKSSIFSVDEEREWKERDERRGRKPSILSTAEEKQLKEREERKERNPSILSTEGVKGYGSVDTSRKNSFLEETDESGTEKRSSLISVRLSKLNFIAQLRNLNREKKAAKTVGIIVGCFIICWAPFFSVYLLGAFCRGCTPPMLFHVFFWLGYCNSAINPFVYGLCSKEFRYAFQKLLRCRCEQRRDDGTLSHNHDQSTSVRSVTRLQSVLQSFKLQIATRSTTNTTNTSPALVTDEDRPAIV